MPYIGSNKELVRAESLLDPATRYRDLAVRLRVLNPDNTLGRVLPHVIGGRWDSWTCRWVQPVPADLRAIEWTIQEQQIPIVLQLPRRIILVAVFAGRQAGKSRVGLMEVVKTALRWPGCESFVVSLNFKASRGPEEEFRSLLDPSWEVRFVAQDRAFKFPHGHTVTFLSAENIDSCRGPSTKIVLLDEASRMSDSVFLAAKGGGAASTNFRLFLTTTPRRECAWIRQVDQEWEGQPESTVIRLRTEDNPRRNMAALERYKRDTPADLYAQEFEGRLVAPPDAAYAALFNRRLHIRPAGRLPDSARFSLARDGNGRAKEPRDYTREWTQRNYHVAADYVMGWDFSKEAVAIGKIYRDTRVIDDGKRKRVMDVDRLWIVGEAVDLHTTTDHHARAVADKWGTSAVVITDAIGAVAGAGGRGDESAAISVLREHGFACVEPIGKSNPAIHHRVKTVCRALRSAHRSPDWPDTDDYPGGEVRLFVVPELKHGHLVEAFENQKMISGKPEKDGKHEHIADAVGYLACAVLPVEYDDTLDGWEKPFREGG